MVVYIGSIPDITCHRPHQHQFESWHLSEFVGDPHIGLVTFLDAPNVLSSALPHSQTYHHHFYIACEWVIRDSSYSEHWPECPPTVRFSPNIEASNFTLHFFSHSPGSSQWLKFIVLMWMSVNGSWDFTVC